MEVKKSNKADLEKKKGVFFQIGLVIVLSFLLFAFDWKSIPKEEEVYTDLGDYSFAEEMTPVTRQIELPPTPPPPKIVENINPVDDNLKINETDIPNMEADQNTSVNDIQNSRNEEEYEDDVPFFLVEEKPKFNGGSEVEFSKYVYQNLVYPKQAELKKIEGTVYIQFTINTLGEITDVAILSGIDPLLDQEVVRIIKSSPRWTPGKQRGHPVRVTYNFPITFKLH